MPHEDVINAAENMGSVTGAAVGASVFVALTIELSPPVALAAAAVGRTLGSAFGAVLGKGIATAALFAKEKAEEQITGLLNKLGEQGADLCTKTGGDIFKKLGLDEAEGCKFGKSCADKLGSFLKDARNTIEPQVTQICYQEVAQQITGGKLDALADQFAVPQDIKQEISASIQSLVDKVSAPTTESPSHTTPPHPGK